MMQGAPLKGAKLAAGINMFQDGCLNTLALVRVAIVRATIIKSDRASRMHQFEYDLSVNVWLSVVRAR
jgi:hypothetical protein